MRTPQEITSDRAGVRAFFDELLAEGVNFHPDTRALEYDPPLPKRYSVNMAKCFHIADLQDFDIYAVAVEAWQAQQEVA